MGPRGPPRASKYRKPASTKTLKNNCFFKVFGDPRPSKTASEDPRSFPRGYPGPLGAIWSHLGDRPKTAPRPSKAPQDRPKIAFKITEAASRPPHHYPRSPKISSRPPRGSPESRQSCSKAPLRRSNMTSRRRIHARERTRSARSLQYGPKRAPKTESRAS
jgi:hypothetical protein